MRAGLPMSQVLDELPMAQGWALIAWDIENDAWLGVERATPGYVAQQAARETTNL